MTDPNGAATIYIWCAMDPININPQYMLALIYQHRLDPSWAMDFNEFFPPEMMVPMDFFTPLEMTNPGPRSLRMVDSWRS